MHVKRLLLIRHAKSSWDFPSVSDHDRPLNKRGKRDAPLMAQSLVAKGESLDVLFSSTATRAFDLAKPIAETLNIPLVTTRELYTFSDSTLMVFIHALTENYKRVGLVSHNPAITELANFLGAKTANVPTSGIIAFDVDVDQWRKLGPSYCRMDYFDCPKNHR
ncbi:MAG: histidine phosphatase family protein [Pseudomonadota bacterium]